METNLRRKSHPRATKCEPGQEHKSLAEQADAAAQAASGTAKTLGLSAHVQVGVVGRDQVMV